jgi:DNA end-binding protein Ku
MRPIWKGSISFGLVNIPVALHTASRSEDLKFKLLRQSDLSPVNYKRVAQVDGKEVPWDQIVKGYEYEKEKYVVLKDEDFKRVDIEASDAIDIMDFVDGVEINPVFFHRPYYLQAMKGGGGAYHLLRQVSGGDEEGRNCENCDQDPAASCRRSSERGIAGIGTDAFCR